jgi:uncharacterized protein
VGGPRRSEILRQCIAGCQSLDMSSPTDMTATVVFKVGPVKATFGGKVTLSDLDPAQQLPDFGRGFLRRGGLCQTRRECTS